MRRDIAAALGMLFAVACNDESQPIGAPGGSSASSGSGGTIAETSTSATGGSGTSSSSGTGGTGGDASGGSGGGTAGAGGAGGMATACNGPVLQGSFVIQNSLDVTLLEPVLGGNGRTGPRRARAYVDIAAESLHDWGGDSG